MAGAFDSFFRGAGQGASLGFNDELAAKLLAALPSPADPEGYSRDYEAGSPEAGYLQKFRRDNAAAAEAHPLAFGAGSVAGSAPLAALVPGGMGGSAAARIAAGGLAGGALGGLSGAGTADGRPMGDSIGRGALMGGLLGTTGAAAAEAAPAIISAFRNMPPPGPTLAPAMAGAGQLPGAASSAASKLPGNAGAASINYSLDRPAIPPKAAAGGADKLYPNANAKIPKAGKAPSEAEANALADVADAYDPLHAAILQDKAVPAAQKNAYDKLVSRAKAANDLGDAPVPANDVTPELPKTVRPPRKKAQTALAESKPAPEAEQLEFSGLDQPNIARNKAAYSAAQDLKRGMTPTELAAQHRWVLGRNAAMRPTLPEMSTEQAAAETARMISEKPGHESVMFRGVNVPKADLERMQHTGTVEVPRVHSFSSDPSVANRFTTHSGSGQPRTGEPILFRHKGSGLPINRLEHELVQGPGRYDISNWSVTPEGVRTAVLSKPSAAAGAPEAVPDERQLKLFLDAIRK